MKNNNKNLITIVTVTYNADNLLEETILSIINQSYQNIEYIIIDGDSTDKTIDIIKKYEDKINYWVSEPDDGIYYAMNKAIKKAKGKWINFMNAGDTFFDLDTVEYVMSHKDKKAELVYGNCQIGSRVQKPHNASEYDNITSICHQTLFVKTKLSKETLFDTRYKISADHDFILKMFQNNKKFHYLDKEITNYLLNGFSDTQKLRLYIEGLNVLFTNNVPEEDIIQSPWYINMSKYLSKKEKAHINDLEKTITYKKFLIKGKNEFIERQKSIIDNQNKIIAKQDKIHNQLSTLFHDTQILASNSIHKNPLKKYKSYKTLLSTYHGVNKILSKEDLKQLEKKSNTNIEYTVISAVYNVAKYLADFFESLTKQSLDFESHICLIMVDDGSPDGSAEIIQRWREKYPDNIFYYKKENGGSASARNFGLQFCQTKWVTFIDPDDFVDKDYFKEVYTFETSYQEKYFSIISCNMIFYMESNQTYVDTHPMKYRYLQGEKIVSDNDLEGMLQLSAAHAFLRYSIIKENMLEFDERIIPNFEDAHFIGKYLLSLEGTSIGFIPNAKYYYRKRLSGDSALDTSWTKTELFDDGLKYGCLDLLEDAKKIKGYVPEYTQRTVLYHLSWFYKAIINHSEVISFLSDDQISNFKLLLQKIFDYIDIQTIQKFNLSGFWLLHKIGLLGMYKKTDNPSQTFIITDYDEIKSQIQVRHIYYFQHNVIFSMNEKEILPLFSKIQKSYFLENIFIYDRTLWLNVDNDASLSIKIENMETQIYMSGKSYGNEISLSEIKSYLIINPFTEENNLIREDVLNPLNQKKYKDAWLLIDRDIQADDNAEHLYRYIMHSHPGINAFFSLRRDSHDWERLKKEGFNLIEFDSYEHKLVYLYAKHLISSHADSYIMDYLPFKWDINIPKTIFTFLQHGVIHNDLSNWLNSKKIDCFITTSSKEFYSIVDTNSKYKFTSREVHLTGLPRHDLLLEGANKQEKLILIMPTWRSSIVGDIIGKDTEGTIRTINENFQDTPYAQHWKSLLHSRQLLELSKTYGYKIVFSPHTNIQPYVGIMDIPKYIEVLSHSYGSVQTLFQKAALMITDYSSVAFEMGILQREVIYYQFDYKGFFNGEHAWQKGYFDYTKDGFGPVCYNEKEVMNELRLFLDSGGKTREYYLKRMQDFFEFHDTNNCQRVFEVIQKLDSKVISSEKYPKQFI